MKRKSFAYRFLGIALILCMFSGFAGTVLAEEADDISYGENGTTFAKDADIATIYIDQDKINTNEARSSAICEILVDEDKDYADAIVKGGLSNEAGFPSENIVAFDTSVYNLEKSKTYDFEGELFSYTFQGAAIANGRPADVVITYSDLHLTVSKDITDGLLELACGNVIRSGHGPSDCYYGFHLDINIQVLQDGKPVEGIFYFTIVDIDVKRGPNGPFGKNLIDAADNNNYSEQIYVHKGFIGKLYLPDQDGVDDAEENDPKGYKCIITEDEAGVLFSPSVSDRANDANGSFYSGFLSVVNNVHGIDLRVWNSGGGNMQMKTFLLVGVDLNNQPIWHRVTSATNRGGNIQTTAAGTPNGDLSDESNVLGPGTVVVPNGKAVTYKMTPRTGYRLEKVTVDGVDVEPERRIAENGSDYYVYTINVEEEDHEIEVSWARIPREPIKVPYVTEYYLYDGKGYFPFKLEDVDYGQGAIGEEVEAVVKEFDGFAFNPKAPGTVTSGTLKAIHVPGDVVVLRLFYDVDAVGDWHSPEDTGDGIPDRYQKKVTFKIENGTWDGFDSSDIVVYLTLKDKEGNWDVNGAARLYAPIGMVAKFGYNQWSGRWDTLPPVWAFGTEDAEYTFSFDRFPVPVIPHDVKVTYKVEHYLAGEDGSYPEVPALVDHEIGDLDDTVNAVPKLFKGYALNLLAEGTVFSGKLEEGEEKLTLKLFYDVDVVGNRYNPEGRGDGIPDKYQKKVTFEVVNGTWHGFSSRDIVFYATLRDESGKWSQEGTANLIAPVGMIAKRGYSQRSGAWDVVPPETVSGTDPVVYTFRFERCHPTTPVTPIDPSDKVLYITEHYKADADGKYPEVATDIDYTQGTIGDKVDAVAKEYAGYKVDLTAVGTVASGTLVAINAPEDIVTLKLFYVVDDSGDPPTPPIPGTTKAVVTYKIVHGTWEDETTTIQVTLDKLDSEGNPSETDSAVLGTTIPDIAKVIAATGYKTTGKWDVTPTAETAVTENTTYTFTLSKKSTGGGGSSTPTPTESLNYEDHFAYVIGYPDKNVHPEATITRAEVATIFFRLLQDNVREANFTRTNSFSDMNADQWFNNAVSTMASMGIVNGYPDGTFKPNENITRAEFAAIAARFDENANSTNANLSDISGHWAAVEIAKAAANGWVNGYPDGTFKPDQEITRAEAMALVNRVLNRDPEDPSDLLDHMIKWLDNMDTDKWYYLDVQEATNSHTYERATKITEKWLTIEQPRDWASLEKQAANEG
jgi:hypothetical protein